MSDPKFPDQGFTSGDMADAAAKGFRDGVASTFDAGDMADQGASQFRAGWDATLAQQPAQQEQEVACYKHGDEPKQGCGWCAKLPAVPPGYKQLLVEVASLLGPLVEDGQPIQIKDARGVLERVRAALNSAPEAPVQVQPDMFWNTDDAEDCYGSIEEFLNHEICNGSLMEVGAEFTMMRAKRLPNIMIRVTSIDEEQSEAEYEVIAPEAQKEQP